MTEKTILSFKSPQMSIRLVERDYGYPFPTYTVLKNRRVYFKSTEYIFAVKHFSSLVSDHILQLDAFDPVPLDRFDRYLSENPNALIPVRLSVDHYEKFIHAEGV